jgi:hypothetical protein
MDNTLMQSILWIVAGLLLVMMLMRRKKRKAVR